MATSFSTKPTWHHYVKWSHVGCVVAVAQHAPTTCDGTDYHAQLVAHGYIRVTVETFDRADRAMHDWPQPWGEGAEQAETE